MLLLGLKLFLLLLMKKLYTFLLILASAASSYGQSFTLSTHQSTCNGAASDAIIECQASITNNSQDSVFEWDKLELTTSAGWSSSFCDPNNCYNVVGNTTQFTLSPGAKRLFKFQCFTNNVAGNGSIKIAIRLKNNPSFSDTLSLSVNGWSTGLNSHTKESANLTIYPNPVQENLFVTFTGKTATTIEVVNLLGAVQLKSVLQNGQSTVDVSDLNPGIYFIRIREGAVLHTSRFIKL